jgi:hypothetical protein
MARISIMAAALTADEFDEAIKHFPRFSEKAVAIARAILVDGRGFDADFQREFDCRSRQLAHDWASRVFAVYQPAGWVTESITLPPDMMAIVKQMEQEARDRLKQEQPPPLVVRKKAE